MKKILTFLFLIIGVLSYGQLDTVNIGTAPNDGTGEPLRNGMIKINKAIKQINTITSYSTNWNTAYTDRLKWDGGSTGLVAGTGRTSLGATTVGAAFFMLTNPSAITFVRINADNTLTALSAANFKTALSLTSTDVGLNNVTNESKATMFTAPTFTGSATFGTIANSLIPTTNDVPSLGNITYAFSDLFLAAGSVINWNNSDITLTLTNNLLSFGGGGLAIGNGYNIAMTGSIGTTTTRLTKIWTNDLEVTNSPTINGTAISTTYAPLASPAFTGMPKIVTDSIATRIYARSVGGATGKLNLADSVNYANGYMTRYDGVIGDAGKIAKADSNVWAGGYVSPKALSDSLSNSVALETIVTLQSDTNAFVATFGLGSGQLGDTSLFNNNAVIGSTTITGSDSVNFIVLDCRILEGSGTESVVVNICWNDTLMAVVPVKLNTSGFTVNILKTKNEDLSFNNAIIPKGKLLYGYITGITAGNKPSYLGCTLSGKKVNRKY